jgi:hypothetical protein
MGCNCQSITWESTALIVKSVTGVSTTIWYKDSMCFRIGAILIWSLNYWNALAQSWDNIYGTWYLGRSVMGLSFLANPSRNRRYLSVNSKNLCPSCSHSLFGRSSIQSIISRAILFLYEAMIYPRYLTLQACHANISGVLIRLYYGNCWSTSMTVLVYFSFDSE